MESIKRKQFNRYIEQFDFEHLFNQLGWNYMDNSFPKKAADQTFQFRHIAEKAGFAILICEPDSDGKIPDAQTRKRIHTEISKLHHEHLIIFIDEKKTIQQWELLVREPNKPARVLSHKWINGQAPELLYQKLSGAFFSIEEDEEGSLTIIDVVQRIKENFGANAEKVTKKFYAEFKKQHSQFIYFIQGIDDALPDKDNTNKQWYASLMLNRLMFCYFIQKKGFLNQDKHYLKNKLKACREFSGTDQFYSFYRSFLLELFHDGLGKPINKRSDDLPVELGKIPYLNGGLFDVHELERQFNEIQIDDDAFERVFEFFDKWEWHLDTREHAEGKTINPDVIGYIFEKYINDRAAMGAYYTKEDITDYIGKNTIIPFLFDETQRQYKKGFKPGNELWNNLKASGDTYIYDAVKHGVPREGGLFDDLPEEIQAGFKPELEEQEVKADNSPHLWEIRKPWNQLAPQEIGLPTEIYRELIERRKRYADLKAKIDNGKITHIYDFITYNLNIRQFTQDFIETTEDPVFILHFYKALNKMTILDPTCGSGAFLFAAMNILEPLYETCIKRMEEFAEEKPGKHEFFEKTLAEVNSEDHPNLQYFIYKSIILNNLFGVDIMHEAVEIAKLRLFLKLVAVVDVEPAKRNFGLEPLPDIDFNIRAGNTLVGFATEPELLRAVQVDQHGQYRVGYEDELNTFKEECELVGKAFSHFQNSQLINDQGSNSFQKAKAELNRRLKNLNHKLNVYLAANYGIDGEAKPTAFKNWLESHQPFHWFAEFYQIVVANGGFDVVIGNPPYVGMSSVLYDIVGYSSAPCGDLYAPIMERCSTQLLNENSKFSMIVPISLVSTDGYSTIREVLVQTGCSYAFSNFGVRPAKLFEGVDKRLTVFVSIAKSDCPFYLTTKYYRWKGEERSILFEKISYTSNDPDLFNISGWGKTSSSIESRILDGLLKEKSSVAHRLVRKSNIQLSFTRKLQYFIQFFQDPPRIYNELEEILKPSELKQLYLQNKSDLYGLSCLLNSSLFFWFFIAFSDCRNVNFREIKAFPVDLLEFSKIDKLKKYCENLWENLKEESLFLTRNDKKSGLLRIESFKPRKSKPIIDQIDTLLAEHYGFTEEELDFIINYDIKYRMGKALFGEEDNGEEED